MHPKMIFDRERYFALLQTNTCGADLHFFPTIGSTNDYLKEHARSLPHGAVAVALEQTAGRGRTGKIWDTRDGTSLAYSILFKGIGPEILSKIPLAGAVAAQEAAQRLCGQILGIKWPNDIVWQGRKLCGILCESQFRDGAAEVICGFGMNLLQSENELTSAGLPYAASLKMACGREVSLEQAAAALSDALEKNMTRLEQDSGTLLQKYRERCVTVGRRIRFTQKGIERVGEALAVDDGGGLIVRCADGERTLNSGEISVRGIYGYI